jgi:hypothetical protein
MRAVAAVMVVCRRDGGGIGVRASAAVACEDTAALRARGGGSAIARGRGALMVRRP